MRTIVYRRHPSPMGTLFLAASDEGVCRVAFDDEQALEETSREFDVVEDPAALDPLAKSLDSYFSGEGRTFDVDLDLSLASPFVQRVLTALSRVPFGEVTTYGRLAAAAKTSARAVGGAVGSNPIPIVIPCHRVIAADGSLGGFSSGLDRKRRLLALEGRKDMVGGWEPRRRRR